MAERKPIGCYRAENSTGWAAFDKQGHTWPITEEEAQELPKSKAFDQLASERNL